MATIDNATAVIVDPSVLFNEEALGWLRDPELTPWLSVSASLQELLGDEGVGDVFAPYDVRPEPDQLREVFAALEPIRKFSHEDAELSQESGLVLEALLSEDDALARVVADEWAFLTSESFAVILEKSRATLARFVKAGAHVYEASNQEMQQVLDIVRDKLPPPVLKAMKAVGRNKPTKLLVMGGNTVGLLVPHIALPAKIAGYALTGIVIVAGDP